MKYTMVIADDESLVLRSQELLIRKEFPEIEIGGMAENGIELKQMVEQLKPDRAIVDVRMPGLTGIEVIELLQHIECRTHFVKNTAYSDFDYVKKALDLKTDGYLLKPGKREENIETIRKLCSEVLLSVFSEKCDEEGFQAFCDIRSIRFCCGCIATFLPVGQAEIKVKELNEELTAALDGLCSFLATVTSNGVVVMFLVPAELKEERRKSWCDELAFLVARHLKEKTGNDFRYGVGAIYDSFVAMKESYRDSISDFRMSCINEDPEEDSRDTVSYVALAKQYVMSSFQSDISLQDCAKSVGISPYYLSHIFRERTGQTFVEYLSMVRIEAAKQLSENRELTTKDIAEQCGYPNITYFCKVFKRQTGMTISEYRRQNASEVNSEYF